MRRTRSSRQQQRRTAPGPLLAALLGLTLILGAACGPGEIGDGLEDPQDDSDSDSDTIDEQGWLLNDPDSERQIMASCPNGGKVVPKAPVFTKAIDGYASYVGQSKCDPTSKPGVVAFQKLILATYPCTASYGIVRGCSVGGTSEHKEGRAWDWGLNYPHPAATSLLAWLTATDSFGNKHAMARRFGIMYMIWNRKIWKSYQASAGWQTYTGSNPHTDHVHFSFSWNGALKKTSFWNPPPQNHPPTGWLNAAGCNEIRGWAQDPDAKTAAINVQITIGSSSYKVKADQYRADLCQSLGTCKHAFTRATPSAFKDGKSHKVRAFALDSKSGAKTELKGSPKTLTCAPPTPPTPNPTSQDTGAGPASSDAGAAPGADSGAANPPGLAPDAGGGSDALQTLQPDGELPAPGNGSPAGPEVLSGSGCSLGPASARGDADDPLACWAWTLALLGLALGLGRRRPGR